MNKIQLEREKCTGCRLCEMVCSLSGEGKMDLTISRIQINPSSENQYQPRVCLQCQRCPPSEVCPTGAFQRDEGTGVVRVAQETCDGCGLCVSECSFSSVFEENGRILVCNLCQGKPKCVEVCHKQAIMFV
ncbi:MAG: 4Fe-4S dicluster domain-containing protein [Proteobacteria bacterium]|nr:4Fe-4S dicluster domain-containing protein [Pseudomonadota bacterium]